MIKKLYKSIIDQKRQERQDELYRKLIRREAKVGGTLFGPIPSGVRREFFCLDERTWVWHEEWTDKDGKERNKTTRYDVRPNGILKTLNGQHYQQVSPEEARNLYKAAQLYGQRIKTQLYNFA